MHNLKQRVKVIVLDLDGTLTNKKKEITPRTKTALMKLQAQGVKVVLASGRPTYGIVPLADELEIAQHGGYILSFNGGTIINWETKEVLHQAALQDQFIAPCYDLAQSHGVNILSYLQEHIITERAEDEYVKYESMLNKMAIKEVDDFQSVMKDPVSKCLIVGNPEVLVSLEKKMQEQFAQEMSIYRSEPFFLEVNPPAIDKAQSLAKLLVHLDLTPEEMVACGDGFNDLSMIEYAGMGVAMANAQDAVKAAANYITSSNEEDGVAEFVEKYLL